MIKGTCSSKGHVRSNKKSMCSILVIVICRSYICLGKEKVVHVDKEEGEEIKVRYNERKKFLCKPQETIVCIM